MSIFFIVLKYSGYLALVYVILFAIDRLVIRSVTKFLYVTIILSIFLASLGALREIALMRSTDFYLLAVCGITISILSEVFLQFYMVFIKRSGWDPKKLIPEWYLKGSLSRMMIITVAYGIAISIPLALHFSQSNNTYTMVAAGIFIALFITKGWIMHQVRRLYGDDFLKT